MLCIISLQGLFNINPEIIRLEVVLYNEE